MAPLGGHHVGALGQEHPGHAERLTHQSTRILAQVEHQPVDVLVDERGDLETQRIRGAAGELQQPQIAHLLPVARDDAAAHGRHLDAAADELMFTGALPRTADRQRHGGSLGAADPGDCRIEGAAAGRDAVDRHHAVTRGQPRLRGRAVGEHPRDHHGIVAAGHLDAHAHIGALVVVAQGGQLFVVEVGGVRVVEGVEEALHGRALQLARVDVLVVAVAQHAQHLGGEVLAAVAEHPRTHGVGEPGEAGGLRVATHDDAADEDGERDGRGDHGGDDASGGHVTVTMIARHPADSRRRPYRRRPRGGGAGRIRP